MTLMQLALSGEGPGAIIDRLADITSIAAVWLSAAGAVRHEAGSGSPGAAIATEVDALLRWGGTVTLHPADPPVRELALPDGRLCLASPIPARDGLGGFVALVGDEQSLDHMARLAAARAAAACAIELHRERAVIETRERMEGEFVESLLTGTYASERAAEERAERLGVPLGPWLAVVCLRGSRQASGWDESALSAARNALQRRQATAFLAAHQGGVCALMVLPRGGADSELARLAETLREDCARATGDPGASAGVGRAGSGAGAVRASYREAEQALAMGRRLLGNGMTASFANLGLHRLLFAIAQHPELADFYEATVGPLLAYDAKGGGELMATLNAFFACNGSPTETAHELHLHRNTVLYRLRRIQEVGGVDLDDAATRLNLHLCLRIRDVLQVAGLSRAEARATG